MMTKSFLKNEFYNRKLLLKCFIGTEFFIEIYNPLLCFCSLDSINDFFFSLLQRNYHFIVCDFQKGVIQTNWIPILLIIDKRVLNYL